MLYHLPDTTFAEHVPYAYELYEKSKAKAKAQVDAQVQVEPAGKGYGALSKSRKGEKLNVTPENYKATFCIPVTIDFVGVWYAVNCSCVLL